MNRRSYGGVGFLLDRAWCRSCLVEHFSGACCSDRLLSGGCVRCGGILILFGCLVGWCFEGCYYVF